MKLINAHFKSSCTETGKTLKKGSPIYYDYATRKAYHPESPTVINFLAAKDQAQPDNLDIHGMDTAQENAYFDNFCQSNNI